MPRGVWRVEATDQYVAWFENLSSEEQVAVDSDIFVLESFGPTLGRPHVDTLKGSKYENMKELRTGTLRSFFAFDPRRVAILLLGGNKRGDASFYKMKLAQADHLYEEHLNELKREGRI